MCHSWDAKLGVQTVPWGAVLVVLYLGCHTGSTTLELSHLEFHNWGDTVEVHTWGAIFEVPHFFLDDSECNLIFYGSRKMEVERESISNRMLSRGLLQAAMSKGECLVCKLYLNKFSILKDFDSPNIKTRNPV